MAAFTLLNTANRTNVDLTSPAVAPAGNVNQVTITITTTNFTDPAQEINLEVHESLDGGANWGFLAGMVTNGGATDRNTGAVILDRSLTVSMGADDRRNRRLRARLRTKGTIRFGVTADVT